MLQLWNLVLRVVFPTSLVNWIEQPAIIIRTASCSRLVLESSFYKRLTGKTLAPAELEIIFHWKSGVLENL